MDVCVHLKLWIILLVNIYLSYNASANCNRYGDMMLLSPNGASSSTAASNRLQVTGMAASQQMVTTDLTRLNGLREIFDRVAREAEIHPALIGALASRESRVGAGLNASGYSDGGNGYGILQCDLSYGLSCTGVGPRSYEHVNQAITGILIQNWRILKNEDHLADWSYQQILQGSVAAFKFGPDDVRTWGGLDRGSTNNDYSNDVIARAQHLVTQFGWRCPGEDQENEPTTTAPPTATTGGCDQLTLVTRSDWGATNARASSLPSPRCGVFIHHTAGAPCTTMEACKAEVLRIQREHMTTKNYSDIAYHFLIGGDGNVYEGRGWGKRGAHSPNHNDYAYGICFIGNFMQSLPTQQAITAARNLIQCGIEQKYLSPQYELFGHRDGRCTDCPGTRLYQEIQTWEHYSNRALSVYCEISNHATTAPALPACKIQAPSVTPSNSPGSSTTRYGDIMLLHPTGASAATANGLSPIGVTASQRIVEMDLPHLEKLQPCFNSVGSKYGIEPALIAALASRESRGGAALNSEGLGDNGNGYGIMQCDLRYSGLNCRDNPPRSCKHVEQLISGKLLLDVQALITRRATAGWTQEQRLQGAVAVYNFGRGNVQTLERLDVTHDDYSNDVMARAQHLVRSLGWAATESLHANCTQLAQNGDCEFYRVCVQRKVTGCDPEKDYPLAYGHKYCTRFDRFYREFTQEGRRWVDEVRVCLMNSLLGHIEKTGISCQEIANIAFNSHVPCYLKSGSGFCSVVLNNKLALYHVYNFRDFAGKYWKEAWKQVLDTMVFCSRSYLDRGTQEFNNQLRELKDYFSSWFTDDERRRRSLTDLTSLRDYARNGDCGFWEVLEQQLSCHGTHKWSTSYTLLLPLCIKFAVIPGISPAARVASFMRETNQCLMNSALSILEESTNCVDVDLHIMTSIIDCMATSGFCDLNRADEYFLDQKLRMKGFPVQLPREFVTFPISGKTKLIEKEYFMGLALLKTMFGQVNQICSEQNERRSPYLYEPVYNADYNTFVNMRTEL